MGKSFRIDSFWRIERVLFDSAQLITTFEKYYFLAYLQHRDYFRYYTTLLKYVHTRQAAFFSGVVSVKSAINKGSFNNYVTLEGKGRVMPGVTIVTGEGGAVKV